MKPLAGAAPLLLLTLVMPAIGAAPVIRATSPQAQPQQGVTSVDERLQLMERRMQMLTDVLIRLDRMQQEIQQLQGSMELHEHAMETLKRRQRDLYGDIDRRMRQMAPRQSQTTAPSPYAAPVTPGSRSGQVVAPAAATQGTALPVPASGISGQPSVNTAVGTVPIPGTRMTVQSQAPVAIAPPAGSIAVPAPVKVPVAERPQLTSSLGTAAPIVPAAPVAGVSQTVQVAPTIAQVVPPVGSGYMIQPVAVMPSQQVPGAIAPAPVAPTADPAMEQPMYKQAFDLLMQRRYEEAKQSFRVFLAQYPNSRLAANSQYWVGEASYVTRDFTSAMADFNKVIQIYPASPKVPDTLLKIAFIQYEQKDWATSRKTLEGLVKKHPASTAARLARKRLERMRIEGN